MRIKPRKPIGFAFKAKMKLLLAFIGLSFLSINVNAQSSSCPQLAGSPHYYRVINANFNTYNSLQADYDFTNNNIIVPSNLINTTGTNDIYLAEVHQSSVINWSRHYPNTGGDQALAVKKASNGDIITVGRTPNSTGNYVLFIMRTSSTGAFIWYKIYNQNVTNVTAFVVVTETVSCHDIVVAGCSFTGSNDLIVMRTSSTGVVKYYEDRSIMIGALGRVYPYLRGITATSDDGYVVVGNTGHNWDFYAALVLKFDANYCTTSVHALNWSFYYRHKLAGGYDLTTAGKRSATYAHAVVEEPTTGNLAVVGYTSDNDQYGTNATYVKGFVMQLSSAGVLNGYNTYTDPNGLFVYFNGINMDGTNYIITGNTRDPNHNFNSQTLITKVSAATLAASSSNLYGTGNTNYGHSVFKTPNGYICVGVSNDHTGAATQPFTLAVDGSCHVGQCYTAITLNNNTDINDLPAFSYNINTTVTATASTLNDPTICEKMYDLCAGACPQLAGKVTYSRVINDAFQTYNFLLSDYDATNKEAIVPSNIASTNDISLTNAGVNSVINFSNTYHVTGHEEALATKKAANGDMITAGRTQNAAGNHILFLMRTDATGNVLWYHAYNQSVTDATAFVVVTETVNCNDIVVAAASFSGSNDYIVMRTTSAGALIYYDDHPININGAGRVYPWIRNITATYDDGYVIVGNTGHNWDFYGALIVKYDANFCTTPTHAQNWSFVYRHPLAVYNLWNAGQRSSTYGLGIVEENNATHQLAIVGSQADNDQYGTNATYVNGFLIQLAAGGGLVSITNYSGNDFVFFNGINMAGTDYIVTGSTRNKTTGAYTTLLTKISTTTLAPVWAKQYGTNNLNAGYSVFQTPNGFLSIGISNDLTGTTSSQPHLLAVDGNGNAGQCYTNYTLNYFSDNNDLPTYTYGTSSGATSNTYTPVAEAICEEMYDLCSSAMKPVKLSGLDTKDVVSDKLINFYPNPTSGTLNVDIKAEVAAQGTVMVTDIQGRQILSSTVSIAEGVNHFVLNTSELKNGVYFIKVSDNKNTLYPVSKITKY